MINHDLITQFKNNTVTHGQRRQSCDLFLITVHVHLSYVQFTFNKKFLSAETNLTIENKTINSENVTI